MTYDPSKTGSGWHIPTMAEVEAMVALHKARTEAARREYLMEAKVQEQMHQAWLLSEKKRMRRWNAMERKRKKEEAIRLAEEAKYRAEREARKQARLEKLRLNPPPPPVSQEAQRRSRMNWAEYLGNEFVAAKQVAWERNATALAMRDAGLTFKDIGGKLGVCGSRAAQIVFRGERDRKSGRRSPAEEYMAVPLLLVDPPKPKVQARLRQAVDDLRVHRDWLLLVGSGG